MAKFPLDFPVSRPWIPAFAGMTANGYPSAKAHAL